MPASSPPDSSPGRGIPARARRESAGLLLFDRVGSELRVFLVHPGGPFFANKDEGSWSLPKGLIDPGETRLDTARREFHEETGQTVEACAPKPDFLELGSVVQRGGKRVFGWAFDGRWPDGVELVSNTFELEWPRGSRRFIEIPEVDRGELFSLAEARRKINPAQEPFLDRLLAALR